MKILAGITTLALGLAIASFPVSALAASAEEIDASVNEALAAFEKDIKGGHEMLGKAAGYLVFPRVIKVGVGVGGEGGEGALRVNGQTVGYYNTFAVEPAYAFGHGLSYTQFEYRDLRLGATEFAGRMTVSVTVRNSGSVPGRDVVQLYLSAPGKALHKPERELTAFAKTGLLEPGGSETVTLTLTGRDLASFDTDRAAWVAEAGTYRVKLGASAADTRLEASFEVPREVVVERAHNVLVPRAPIPERTAPRK